MLQITFEYHAILTDAITLDVIDFYLIDAIHEVEFFATEKLNWFLLFLHGNIPLNISAHSFGRISPLPP